MNVDISIFDQYITSGRAQDLEFVINKASDFISEHQEDIVETLETICRYDIEDAAYGKGDGFWPVLNMSEILVILEPENSDHLSTRALAAYQLALTTQDNTLLTAQYFDKAMQDFDELNKIDPEDRWVQGFFADCLVSYSEFQGDDGATESVRKAVSLWEEMSAIPHSTLDTVANQWWELCDSLKESERPVFNDLWSEVYELYKKSRDNVKGDEAAAWLHDLSHLYTNDNNINKYNLAQELRVLWSRIDLMIEQGVSANNLQNLGSQMSTYWARVDFPLPKDQTHQVAIQCLRAACDKVSHRPSAWVHLSKAYENIDDEFQALQVCMEGASHGISNFGLALQGAKLAKKAMDHDMGLWKAIAFQLATLLKDLSRSPDAYLELVECYTELGLTDVAKNSLKACLECFHLHTKATDVLNNPVLTPIITDELKELLLVDADVTSATPRGLLSEHESQWLAPLSELLSDENDEFDENAFWIEAENIKSAPLSYWSKMKQGRILLKAFPQLMDSDKKQESLIAAYDAFKEAELIRPNFHIAARGGCLKAIELGNEIGISCATEKDQEQHWKKLRESYGSIIDDPIVHKMILHGSFS